MTETNTPPINPMDTDDRTKVVLAIAHTYMELGQPVSAGEVWYRFTTEERYAMPRWRVTALLEQLVDEHLADGVWTDRTVEQPKRLRRFVPSAHAVEAHRIRTATSLPPYLRMARKGVWK